jgi:hypothetical protein
MALAVADFLVPLFRALRQGLDEKTTDTVRALTRIEPRDFGDRACGAARRLKQLVLVPPFAQVVLEVAARTRRRDLPLSSRSWTARRTGRRRGQRRSTRSPRRSRRPPPHREPTSPRRPPATVRTARTSELAHDSQLPWATVPSPARRRPAGEFVPLLDARPRWEQPGAAPVVVARLPQRTTEVVVDAGARLDDLDVAGAFKSQDGSRGQTIARGQCVPAEAAHRPCSSSLALSAQFFIPSSR